MGTNRCEGIIPASGYYEWSRKDRETNQKQKYVFFRSDSRLIYMAGLYMIDEASHIPYYTILTKDAAPHIAQIHGRMPVILPQDAIAKWLSPVGSYPELISFANSDIRASSAEQ